MELVYIEWIDSRGVSEQWRTFDDLKEHDLCTIMSAGFVLRETDDFIQIVPHIGTDPDQGCGDMTIPKTAITKRKRLSTR